MRHIQGPGAIKVYREVESRVGDLRAGDVLLGATNTHRLWAQPGTVTEVAVSGQTYTTVWFGDGRRFTWPLDESVLVRRVVEVEG